jgi:hypothetical protein
MGFFDRLFAPRPTPLEWTPEANTVRSWRPTLDDQEDSPPADAYGVPVYIADLLLESTTQAARGPLGVFLARRGVARGGLQLDLLYLLSALSIRSIRHAGGDNEIAQEAMGALLNQLRSNVASIADDFEAGFPSGLKRYSAAVEGTADLTQGALALAKGLPRLDNLGQTATYLAVTNLVIDFNITLSRHLERVAAGRSLETARKEAMHSRLESAFTGLLAEQDQEHEWEPGDACPACEDGVLFQLILEELPDAYALECDDCGKALVYESDLNAIERNRRPLAGLVAAEAELAKNSSGIDGE